MDQIDRLQKAGHLAKNVPIGPLTTYKFGGSARYLVTVEEARDLSDAHQLAVAEGIPIVALGRGSNVVVSDRGFAGVVLQAGPALRKITIDGSVVTAGAGVPLPLLARETAKAGRGGLEFFVGIPGSVGGAICMNAGGHGSETADVLQHALVFDAATGTATERTPKDLEMGYRHSSVGLLDFVLEAAFQTVAREPAEAEAELREITRWRRTHQPGGTLNAGSAFKNPPGDSAGRIIDSLGLKGFSVGGVSVSERHANFFVAGEGAAASDVHALINAVQRRVREELGVELVPEVRFLGDFE